MPHIIITLASGLSRNENVKSKNRVTYLEFLACIPFHAFHAIRGMRSAFHVLDQRQADSTSVKDKVCVQNCAEINCSGHNIVERELKSVLSECFSVILNGLISGKLSYRLRLTSAYRVPIAWNSVLEIY